MSSPLRCSQPGCSGFIQDGFCNVCGLEGGSGADTLTSRLNNGTGGSVTIGTQRLRSGTFRAKPFGTAALARGTQGNTPILVKAPNGGQSGSIGTGTKGSGRLGASSRRTTSSRRSGSSRRQLGLGLVQVPELPPIEAEKVVMANPEVPERKRICPKCEEPQSRQKGFCRKCGTAFNFLPSLEKGDVIAGQYEVIGPMAFGGLGWIYLARDNKLNRWVVLKGLLNAQDEASAAAAAAEKQFLAAVKHPNIVGVYNFVQQGGAGYIVMEYVGGMTLKAIRKERGPLPVPEAISYIHRILGAFAYLHRQAPPLVYCDFKPDNFMVEGDDVKLIDMGGVRRVDDPGGDIYGTVGFSAPEAGQGPSIVSDLYTVARTLAVLIMDFKFQSAYEFSIPAQEEQPILAQHESLYRFLLKSTRHDPDERFQSADEMADQLAGVLGEIVALETRIPRPRESILFGGETLSGHTGKLPAGPKLIPSLKLDPLDPAAQALLINSHGSLEEQIAACKKIVDRFPASAEARLRLARLYLDCATDGAIAPPVALPHKLAGTLIDEVENMDPFDWRCTWLRGLSEFIQGNNEKAANFFNLTYSELPGELAPKLALALTAEATNETEAAIFFYDLVGQSDVNMTSAIFGLARCLIATDRERAKDVYNRIPASSSAYNYAQICAARVWLSAEKETDIVEAAKIISALKLDRMEAERLKFEVFKRALDLVESAKIPESRTALFDRRFQANSLRAGIENTLRRIAHLATNRAEKVNYVDLANEVRPRTLV
jgi:serine/threonine-protein kinase PknG